jgi:hypothetical protein
MTRSPHACLSRLKHPHGAATHVEHESQILVSSSYAVYFLPKFQSRLAYKLRGINCELLRNVVNVPRFLLKVPVPSGRCEKIDLLEFSRFYF